MRIECITTVEGLGSVRNEWNRLAGGLPFRGWEWLDCWWKHYKDGKRLCVLSVYSEDRELVGVAPWFIQQRGAWGNVIQFLGSGDVCSDHMSLIVSAKHERNVVTSIANWLVETSDDSNRNANNISGRWDLLELTGVDADDRLINCLSEELSTRGMSIHRRPAPSCWKIELPETTDEYRGRLSKNLRKKLRRLWKHYQSDDDYSIHQVRDCGDLAMIWGDFVQLHQQRQESRGKGGCFAREHFSEFLRDAAGRLLETNQLKLNWLSNRGKAVAVEFLLCGASELFAYQSGMSNEHGLKSPGTVLTYHALKEAIESGVSTYDLLRGDEAYKQRWAAKEVPAVEIRIAAPRMASRVRHKTWIAGARIKQWADRQLASSMRPTTKC